MKDFALYPFQPPKYKFHTQAVDRVVKLVTDAASSVVGKAATDGFIRQHINSRKEEGRFTTKVKFLPKLEKS